MTTPAAAPVPYAEFDGHPATEDDLRTAAFFTYGHFTAMQVREGRVRGLRLHLDRLDSANRALFELPLDGGRVRELIRHALRGAGVADGSVRVHGFLPPGATATTVMVTVRGPARLPAEPKSMMSVPYARAVPHLKRPGEFGQTYYGNLASRAGFDDALLTLPDGSVTEGRSPTSASGTAIRSSGPRPPRCSAPPWRCWSRSSPAPGSGRGGVR